MAANICDQIKSGNYKTVRLLDGKIRLFSGDQSYTFKEGNIKSAQIEKLSKLFAKDYDLSPIQECFVNNGKVYYIRQNKAVVYDGQNISSFDWNVYNSNIPRLILKKSDQIIGFMVPPNSRNTGSGQSIAQSNDIQVMAYGSGSSVSVSTFNRNLQITYNGWSIPSLFNAFIANSDDSLTFFKGNKYCISHKNSKSKCESEWKDVNTLFGC